jgi:NADPH2:quinone reductase
MMKRQTITGSTLRPRSVAQKGEIAAALKSQVLPLFEAGKAKPVIYKTLKLAERPKRHR